MILECEDCLHTVRTTPSVHPTKNAHRVQIQCRRNFFLISLQMTSFHFAPQCHTLAEHAGCMCTVQHMEDRSGTKAQLGSPRFRLQSTATYKDEKEGGKILRVHTHLQTCTETAMSERGPVQTLLIHHRPSCSKAGMPVRCW